jgi:hypothetical protein
MNSELKIFAVISLTIVVLYMFFTSKNLQAVYVQDIANGSHVGQEGFEDRGSEVKKINERLEGAINQLDDSLHIKKYRKEYEELITKADDFFEIAKIQALTSFDDMKKVDQNKGTGIAMSLFLYNETKEALDSCMNFIDSR